MKIKVKAIELDNLLNEQIGLIPKLFRTLKAGGKLIDDLGPLASELQSVRRALSAMKIPRALRGNSTDDILQSIFEATPDLQGQMDSVIGTVITSLRNGEAVEIGDEAVEGAVRLRFKGRIKFTDPNTGLNTRSKKPVSIYLTVTKDGVVEGSVGLGKTGSSKSLKAWKANGGRRVTESPARINQFIDELPEGLKAAGRVLGKIIAAGFKITTWPFKGALGMPAFKMSDFRILADRAAAQEAIGATEGFKGFFGTPKNVDRRSRKVARINAGAVENPQAIVPATVDGKIVAFLDPEGGLRVGVWADDGAGVEFVTFSDKLSFLENYSKYVSKFNLPEWSGQGMYNTLKQILKDGKDYYWTSNPSWWMRLAKPVADLFLLNKYALLGLRLGGPALRSIAASLPVKLGSLRTPNLVSAVTPGMGYMSKAIGAIGVLGYFGLHAKHLEKFMDGKSEYDITQIRNLAEEIRQASRERHSPNMKREEVISNMNELLFVARNNISQNSKKDKPEAWEEALTVAPNITDKNYKNMSKIAKRVATKLDQIADMGSPLATLKGLENVLYSGDSTAKWLWSQHADSLDNEVHSVSAGKPKDSSVSPREWTKAYEEAQQKSEELPGEVAKAEQINAWLLAKNKAYTFGSRDKINRAEVDTTDPDEFVPTPKPDQAIPTTSRLGPGGISDFLDEALSSNDIILKPVKASAKMKVKLTELKNED